MRGFKLKDYKIYHLPYYFFLYSFIGWCIETVYMSVKTGVFVNRGFLYGPFCPIYGVGALILILLLTPIKKSLGLFFLGSIIITTVLEYTTALVLESTLNSVLWDYSDEFLNIQGRICLKFSLVWGIISVLILYILHPHIQQIVIHIPLSYNRIIPCLVMLYFLIDFTASAAIASGIDARLTSVNILLNSNTGEFQPQINLMEDVANKLSALFQNICFNYILKIYRTLII